MDRQAQIKRLVWLATTDLKPRKVYAWETALSLDKEFPGISDELKQLMTGQVVNLESADPIQQKPPLAGKKSVTS